MRLGRIDAAHGESHAALPVDLEYFHAHDIAFLELVAHPLDALVGDLRDMHQAVTAGQDGDEGAEIHQAYDFALVDAPDFHVGGDEFDAPLCLAPGGAAHRGNLHRAVVFDVDRRAGLFGDLADDRTTLADDVANLFLIDLERDDRGRPVGHFRARA